MSTKVVVKMGFWKWYFKQLLGLFKPIFAKNWLIAPKSEALVGSLFAIIGSIYLGFDISPWLLFLTIPVGVTMFFHALYREAWD